MKAKQSSLLTQLDALDKECGDLRVKLTEVSNNREKLAVNMKQVQAQYELVQQHLSTEQVRKIMMKRFRSYERYQFPEEAC